MKNRFLQNIFYSLFFVGALTSCAEDDFATPTIECIDTTNGAVATITGAELYAMATSTLQQFPVDGPELFVEAYITSSDRGGNFFKVVSMETADGKGMSVSIDMYNAYNKGYQVGRKILVKLNSLYFIINHNSLSIGELYVNPNSGAHNTGRIAERNLPNHIFFTCDFKPEAELMHEVTIEQAKNNNYINKLLKVKDIQFDVVNVPYYDPLVVIGGSTNRDLINANNNKLIFRTGSFADYAGNIIPNKSGYIIGVMTKFNSDFQFVARDRHDIVLDQLPLSEQPEPEPEIPTDPTNLFFGGSDFEDWNVFNASVNNFGLKYTTQGIGTGVNNSNSLRISGTPTGNDYAFTILSSAKGNIPANPTKITLWVKGTSAKSLSFNVYRPTSGYEVFNVDALTTLPKVLSKATVNNETGNGTNGYIGVINTNNQWVKITLDISDVQLNLASGDLIAMKVGKDAAYDLHIDNIEIE